MLPTAGNLEQIRDILFGKSMQELEERFVNLQESLTNEITVLRDDTKKMFNTLETYVKEELNSLGQQLKSEADEREESDERITREKDTLAKKFNSFEKETTRVQSDIRSQILDLNKKFSDELSDARKDLTHNLKKAQADLQNKKTDRSKLSSLLTEMALRISDEDSETN